MPFGVGAHGPMTWVKKVETCPYDDVTHKKAQIQNFQLFQPKLGDFPHL